MKSKSIITAALAAAIATPVMAQDISGASVSGAYRQFTDDDVDSSVLSLQAGVEVGLASTFAVGGNLAFIDGDDLGAGATSGTLHGMYKYSPNSAIGVFAAAGSDDSIEASTFGIEVGSASETTRFEAYYGIADSDDFGDEDVSIAGFNFEFAVASGFSLGIDYTSFTIADGVIVPGGTSPDDLTFSDTSVIARYAFAEGASVFAEIGQIGASATSGGTTFVSVNELEYFAIGAEYKLGRGNIFSDRSYVGFGG